MTYSCFEKVLRHTARPYALATPHKNTWMGRSSQFKSSTKSRLLYGHARRALPAVLPDTQVAISTLSSSDSYWQTPIFYYYIYWVIIIITTLRRDALSWWLLSTPPPTFSWWRRRDADIRHHTPWYEEAYMRTAHDLQNILVDVLASAMQCHAKNYRKLKQERSRMI